MYAEFTVRSPMSSQMQIPLGNSQLPWLDWNSWYFTDTLHMSQLPVSLC